MGTLLSNICWHICRSKKGGRDKIFLLKYFAVARADAGMLLETVVCRQSAVTLAFGFLIFDRMIFIF
jgi:hypothetical protein